MSAIQTISLNALTCDQYGEWSDTHVIVNKQELAELEARSNLLDRLEFFDCMDLNKLNSIEDAMEAAHLGLFAPN